MSGVRRDERVRRAGRSGIVLLLVLALLTGAVAVPEAAQAQEGMIGTVVTAVLNVRSGPGTLNQVMGTVYMGEQLTILGTEKDALGEDWYRIDFHGRTGYVNAAYVTVTSGNEYVHDDAFEAQLTAQGFPESYKPYLRKLHADHPGWVFEAAQTGLGWSDVIDRESQPGVTLIAGTAPSSWKSTDPGAYDVETGRYVQFDTGNWVTASRAIIEYYMDPRNFLNDGGIFQFLTHAYNPVTQTREGLSAVLEGTFMGGLFPEEGYETYLDVLMEVGASTGVNPYVLASMILVEQGNTGIGRSITGTEAGYEGYYNFFNVGAYASGGMTAVQRGLWYASQAGSYSRPWNSRYLSILGGAQFYATEYVQRGKNTLYLKKFNVMNGLENVGRGQYMSNLQGAESEAAELRLGYLSVMEAPKTFYIPVYVGMPETAVLKPQATANNNNYLTSLVPSDGTLSPAFTPEVSDYVLRVGTQAMTLSFTAVPAEPAAVISGNTTVTLAEGMTGQMIALTVRAPSGLTRTYTVTIVRDATLTPPPSDDPDGHIRAGVEATTLRLSSALTEKGHIKLTWTKSPGFKVDYYEVYRSLEKDTGYGTAPYYVTADGSKTDYTNTKELLPGTRYYYRVRGVRTLDGEKVYTKWSGKAWRTMPGKKPSQEPAEPSEPSVPSDPSTPSEPAKGDDPDGHIRAGVEATTLRLSSALTEKGNVKLTWTKSPGYKVDYYEVYRSLEKDTGYGTAPYYVTADGSKTDYTNTKELLPGTRYYYRVRGVRTLDGEKVYTKWSSKAWRTVR